MKIIKYFIQAFIIYLLFLIIKIIGLNNSRIVFSKIFVLFGSFFKSDNIINKNLQIVYKDLDAEDKKKIKQQMWSNYGKVFVEYMFLKKFRENLFSDHHIQIKGIENLEGILKNKQKAIFVSGHFANFELMSMELTKLGVNLATIYRPLNNFFINPLMENLRKKYICHNQIKKGISGIREAINFLKNNTSIALMLDQRLSEGEKINFFNQPALTTTLPAQLALKFKCPIIPIFISRTPKNYFIMEIMEPINFNNYEKETYKIDTTTELNKILEKMITRSSGQWIWTHDRWKS